MKLSDASRKVKSKQAIALAITTLATGFLSAGCNSPSSTTGQNNPTPTATSTATTTPAPSTPAATTPSAPAAGGTGLKIGSLLPVTGDLSSIGQALPEAIRLAVDNVNKCGGVNGQPVAYISEDDQTAPDAGTIAMTNLTDSDKVAGVIGSFAS